MLGIELVNASTRGSKQGPTNYAAVFFGNYHARHGRRPTAEKRPLFSDLHSVTSGPTERDAFWTGEKAMTRVSLSLHKCTYSCCIIEGGGGGVLLRQSVQKQEALVGLTSAPSNMFFLFSGIREGYSHPHEKKVS